MAGTIDLAATSQGSIKCFAPFNIFLGKGI
jgi:hypothetical protein